ncbi:MAG: hypothetical protein DLM54_00640 [Acidimicrobiales bacterium]|nr:MAG: hypothetical protein DLM54_00640 [Acidimicrobiales bacterium]
MVIEIMTFRLRTGVGEAEFMAADQRVQTEFAYRQPGMIRRTTGHNRDGGWVVIDLWASTADADGSLHGWHHQPVPLEFMALVDEASVRTQRFEALD